MRKGKSMRKQPRRLALDSFCPKSCRPGSVRSPRQIRGVSHGMLREEPLPPDFRTEIRLEAITLGSMTPHA
jgi:hypothetical protein